MLNVNLPTAKTFYCLHQCRLPADLPSDSLVVVTYNSSYMADMKTANVQRRSLSIAPHLLTDCLQEVLPGGGGWPYH